MATETRPGADFWADLGVGSPSPGRPADTAPEPKPGPADDTWGPLFSEWGLPAPDGAAASPDTPPDAPAGTPPDAAPDTLPDAPAAAPRDAPAPAPPVPAPPAPVPTVRTVRVVPPGPTLEATADPAPPAAEPSWAAAERIADTLRPQIVIELPGGDTGPDTMESWRGMLLRCCGGDGVLAEMVYDVLSGWHLLGRLWRDPRVHQVHVRGAQVTAAGPYGVWPVPGFPDLATARRTLATIERLPDAAGVTVDRVAGSTVVGRAHAAHPDTAALVAGGVITAEVLRRVERAVAQVRTVTVTGPAAGGVARALASLIPAGSRVFQGPYGMLPAGCVTAASPLDADYVVGVRPGTLAEEMAAAGQLGAVIANPRTAFRATVRLAVSGRQITPGKITTIRDDAAQDGTAQDGTAQDGTAP